MAPSRPGPPLHSPHAQRRHQEARWAHPPAGSSGIDTTVTLTDGTLLENTPSREFGLIVRYSPDRIRQPERRWFFVAGLDEAGSAAAGQFLAHQWTQLQSQVDDDDDFVAVVSLPLHAWWEPTLTHVVTRSR